MMAGLVPSHEDDAITPAAPRKRKSVTVADPAPGSVKASKNGGGGATSKTDDNQNDAPAAAESGPDPKTDAGAKRGRGRPPAKIKRKRRGLYLSDVIFDAQDLAQQAKRRGMTDTNASEMVEALLTFQAPKSVDEYISLVQRYRDEFGVTEDPED